MAEENNQAQVEQGQQGVEQAAPAFDPNKFVPVEKYSNLEREFGEYKGKFSETERKLQEWEERFNPKPKDSSPQRPDPTKYDFKKIEDVHRYQDDLSDFQDHRREAKNKEREAKEAPQRSQREVEEGRKELYQTYTSKKDEYLEANPEAARKFANADVRIADDSVTDYVVASEYGPQIVEHLIDNPQDLQKLNAMINRGEIRQVQRMITRWELNAEEASKPQKRGIGSDRVPDIGRQMGGSGKGKFDVAKEVRKIRSL